MKIRTEKYLSKVWAETITGDAVSRWPYRIPLQTPAGKQLETEFGNVRDISNSWLRRAGQMKGVTVETANRKVYGANQTLVTHATIDTIDTAAVFVGNAWPEKLDVATRRRERITKGFPCAQDLAAILRDVDGYTDVDFALMCDVSEWFMNNNPDGLTMRQVPIPGLSTKWLEASKNREKTILQLSGLENLNVTKGRPTRINFTYLDPEHRVNGVHYASATVGDKFVPAYTPEVIIICENKDTALYFPEIAKGIAVEGNGFGGTPFTEFKWIADTTHLLYWGDMDAKGFEILNGFRKVGVPVDSILMNMEAYEMYKRYGTHFTTNGAPVPVTKRVTLTHLTEDEQLLYLHLTDPIGVDGPRQIEQERIPLQDALGTVLELVHGEVGFIKSDLLVHHG